MFVNVVASIQYRALSDKASDAFYKLSNTKEQIQAYVFDGTFIKACSLCLLIRNINNMVANFVTVIRASVPKLDLDSTFEQKDEIAKAVENELEKVAYICSCQTIHVYALYYTISK